MTVVGVQAWLPWPLRAWTWWTRPVRAECLAVLRIGLAFCLLVDLLTSYRSHLHDFFGNGALRALFGLPFALNETALFWLWVAATVLLLIGYWTRYAAALAWLLSLTFAQANPFIDNAGDVVRTITLFYLMLCPCGAVWSVDCFRQRHRGAGPIYVWPWPLRLLFIQLVLIYFMNGLAKLSGGSWLDGTSVYYVLGDLTLSRVSLAQVPLLANVMRIATWLVLFWELTFPVLVLFRRTRAAALAFGVAFHLGVWMSLELGSFAPYMLCLYLPIFTEISFRARREDASAKR
jgi:hypothetical protein